MLIDCSGGQILGVTDDQVRLIFEMKSGTDGAVEIVDVGAGIQETGAVADRLVEISDSLADGAAVKDAGGTAAEAEFGLGEAAG